MINANQPRASRGNGSTRPSFGRRGTFQARLTIGEQGETVVRQWLRRLGFAAIPLCDLPSSPGHGPRIAGPDEEFVAPDFLVFRAGRARFVDAKTKGQATWHRASRAWMTGISSEELAGYQQVAAAFGIECFVFFLHMARQPDPATSSLAPVGLFGDEVERLAASVHHRHGEMSFWSFRDLRLIATLDQLGAMPPNDNQDAGRPA